MYRATGPTVEARTRASFEERHLDVESRPEAEGHARPRRAPLPQPLRMNRTVGRRHVAVLGQHLAATPTRRRPAAAASAATASRIFGPPGWTAHEPTPATE